MQVYDGQKLMPPGLTFFFSSIYTQILPLNYTKTIYTSPTIANFDGKFLFIYFQREPYLYLSPISFSKMPKGVVHGVSAPLSHLCSPLPSYSTTHVPFYWKHWWYPMQNKNKKIFAKILRIHCSKPSSTPLCYHEVSGPHSPLLTVSGNPRF
jgi:hypothetical protein